MAYTAEQVASMLESSFEGDSSDDNLDFDAEELLKVECREDTEQGKTQ